MVRLGIGFVSSSSLGVWDWEMENENLLNNCHEKAVTIFLRHYSERIHKQKAMVKIFK